VGVGGYTAIRGGTGEPVQQQLDLRGGVDLNPGRLRGGIRIEGDFATALIDRDALAHRWTRHRGQSLRIHYSPCRSTGRTRVERHLAPRVVDGGALRRGRTGDAAEDLARSDDDPLACGSDRGIEGDLRASSIHRDAARRGGTRQPVQPRSPAGVDENGSPPREIRTRG